MTKESKTKPEMPKVYLATELYVENKMAEQKAETKQWIDRVIDQQNEMHRRSMDLMRSESQAQTRWIVGLLIALIVAILVRPYFG